MAYSQPPSGIPHPGFGPSTRLGGSIFNFGISFQAKWVTEGLQEIKDLKLILHAIGKIEKSIYTITVKVSELDIKVSDRRQND